MRILFIAPYAPGHVRVRSFHLLRQLLWRGHQVTLACPEWRGDGQSRVGELEAAGARVVRAPISRARSWMNCAVALARREPMQARHAWSPALERLLRAEVARQAPDVVHVEHLRATRYALRLDGTAQGRPSAWIWDSVDCISSLLAQAAHHSHSPLWRLAARLELRDTRRYEAHVARSFDRVLLVSEPDLRALSEAATLARRARGPDATPLEWAGRRGEATDTASGGSVGPPWPTPSPHFAVLANGVDVESFAYHDPGDRRSEVVFSGALSYHANDTAVLHLVEAIMPRVWAERPEVRLVVVGPSPSRALRRHAARDPQRLRLTGWVPSVREPLTAAAVAAVPMRYGAGIQNKVLEAMACGTPVVTDPRSGEAIGARAGEELLTAGDDEAFAGAILELLADPALRRRLGKAGRRRVETHFSWEAAAGALERHYEDALASRREHSDPRG